jgi:competence protein ComEC
MAPSAANRPYRLPPPLFDARCRACWLVAGMLPPLQWLSQRDYAVWQPAAPPLWTLFPALLGVLWLLLPRGVPARWMGGLLLLPMLWLAGIGGSHLSTPPEAPSTQPLASGALRPGEMRLTMLDVGQGLAVVVRTASQVLLFDSGPRYGLHDSAGSNAGSRLVLPYLRGEGIGALDVLVLSHWDADHAGGAVAISAALPVSQLYVSEPAPPGLATPQARYQGVCRATQSWQIDGVRFRFLSPDPALADDPLEKRNDRSCVLRVDSAYGSVLLLADIERRAEARLIAAESTANGLKTDVLLVPHHGSATSSSAEFIAATRPQLALVSAGYRNRFRHPRAEVVERWQQAGAQVLRTDEEGALQVQFAPGGLQWQRQRSLQQRYWY